MGGAGMDLTTLGFMLMAAFGLIAGDAIVSGDTVYLDMSVSSELKSAGVDDVTAETLFEYHVARMTRHPTIISAPRVRSSRQQTLIEAIGTYLKVEPIRVAAQKAIGMTPIELHVSLQSRDKQARLVVAGYDHRKRPLLIDVEKPIAAYLDLIEEGAGRFVRAVGPYDYAMHLIIDRADDAAAQRLLREVIDEQRDPALGAVSTDELALFENLAGIVALIAGEPETAERAFVRASVLAPKLHRDEANLAFLHVRQGRHAEAVAVVNGVLAQRGVHPDVMAAALVTRGIALWRLGMVKEAAADFRNAVRSDAHGVTAYHYWSMMEAKRGNAAEAARLTALRDAKASSFVPQPELAAHFLFLPETADQPLVIRKAGR